MCLPFICQLIIIYGRNDGYVFSNKAYMNYIVSADMCTSIYNKKIMKLTL